MKPIVRSDVYPLFIVILTVIACILYWKSLIDTQRVEMDVARHRGELHVQQINEAVDQQLDATLRSVDTALRHLRTVYLHSRKDFDRSVRDILAAYPEGMLQFVSVVGSDGYLAYLSELKPNAKPDHVYFGDREHVQVHADSNQDNMFISKPLFGRIVKAPLIQITRPIRKGNHLVGVIGIPLSPEYLSNNLGELSIDPHDLISIVREDGRIIARSRKLEEGLKLTTPSDRPFMHSHPREHGIYRSVSITDQVPLLFSWRHLANYPIIAVTAIDEMTELAGITGQQSNARKRTLQAMVLVNAFAIWISLLIIRVNRKNHELALNEGNLLESEARFRSIIEASPIPYALNDEQQKITYLNASFISTFGYTLSDIPTLDKWWPLAYPDPIYRQWVATSWQSNLEKSLEGNTPFAPLEVNIRCKNGSECTVLAGASRMGTGIEKTHLVVLYDITQRKQIENALRENEARLRIMLNNEMVGIVTVKDRIIQWANPAFEKILGYETGELNGASTRQNYLSEDAYQSFGESAYPILSEGKIFRAEIEQRHKNGSRIWVDLSGSMLNPETGESLWAFIDISERKQADAEHIRLLKIIQDAPDFIAMSDMQAHLTYLNSAGAKLVGLPDNVDLSTLEIKDMHPDWATRKVMEEGIPAVLKHGYWQSETALLHRDGHETPVLQMLLLHRDESGNPEYLSTIMRDITDRKQTESDLRIAATAFESQEGMSISDAKGIIIKVNLAFTRITGYSAKEIIGKSQSLLKSGRHNANFYAAMWESINNTGTWQGEIWNRRKNGDVYPEYLTITAVKNADGIVTNYVSTLTDITLTKAAEDEIKHLAFYDALTRLPNRRLLLDRLRQSLASIERSGKTGAILFIDLDNFKTLNDTLGHDIGDILLQQVANRLESCVREGDTVARLGGDEFVVMLEDLSKDSLEAAEQTESVGIKILATLNQPYQLASHEHHSTPSIGATLFTDNSQSIDDLMKQADIAMYQSKKAGRNTLHFFDPKMQEVIDTRATLERELREALEKQQFQLYFQLQVDGIQANGTHRPIGAEVLIRWAHPEKGIISPALFIPLAEETGLILPIGQWVLDTACAQIKAWENDAATQVLVLAVNVSAKQFRQPDFVSHVKETVKRHAINPSHLKLELTESLLLEDIEGTISIMKELNEAGFRFSLDDFGTGYSSLQYLKRLPLEQIKIDQSFVRDIVFDVNDRAIVRTIIAMARSLNLNYIAEGVETEEQRRLLFGMGCTHYQGYLFGKPVPIDQFQSHMT